ncbi:MAG TPA: hypothetical protein DCQ06_05890 [Myxococcales bacterium]|nr:hypothetical protein [Myxococcales bacterium]
MREIADAYYQAMMLTAYLNEAYGFDKLRKLVFAHKSAKPTAILVTKVYGRSPERIDEEFRQWLRTKLVRYADDFRPSRKHIRALWSKSKSKDLNSAAAALQRGGVKGIIEQLRRAVTPGKAEPKARCAAQFVLMEHALANQDWRAALRASRALCQQRGCDGVKQRLVMAKALKKLGKPGTDVHLKAALNKDPEDPSTLALARQWASTDADKARWLRQTIMISPNDVGSAIRLATLSWKQLWPNGLRNDPQGTKRSSMRKSAIDDLQFAANQLEETTPHTANQALWEARALVAQGRWRAASLVYPLAADRSVRAEMRQLIWCELADVAAHIKNAALKERAARKCRNRAQPSSAKQSPGLPESVRL